MRTLSPAEHGVVLSSTLRFAPAGEPAVELCDADGGGAVEDFPGRALSGGA